MFCKGTIWKLHNSTSHSVMQNIKTCKGQYHNPKVTHRHHQRLAIITRQFWDNIMKGKLESHFKYILIFITTTTSVCAVIRMTPWQEMIRALGGNSNLSQLLTHRKNPWLLSVPRDQRFIVPHSCFRTTHLLSVYQQTGWVRFL